MFAEMQNAAGLDKTAYQGELELRGLSVVALHPLCSILIRLRISIKGMTTELIGLPTVNV
jgi:hypothetical protein